jgi:hypothetical protein
MSIKSEHHQCIQNGYWDLITVLSRSEKGKYYEVLIMDATDLDEVICECLSFHYRGQCGHQIEAINQLCLWSSNIGPERQTKEQYQNQICPRCAGPTERMVESE